MAIAEQKPCRRCREQFAKSPEWSARQWIHRFLCAACEVLSLKERIEANVRIDERGCWIWTKSTKCGYGQTSVHDKNQSVHVLAYRLYRGEVPAGLDVCHTCDVRPCCNPEHLFLGTRADNMQDCKAKGRMSFPPKTTGEKHHLVTLSDAQVEAVRAARAKGASQRKVAAQFGCSQSTVWRLTHQLSRRAAE